MKVVAIAAGLLLAAGAAGAQAPGSTQCPAGNTTTPTGIAQRATQDACQLAVDLFEVMAPQLGLAITGGNPNLGQSGALGGLGHFTVGVRANVFRGTVPQIQNVTLSTSGRVQRGTGGTAPVPTDERFVGLPTVDAGIGLFKGFPLGLTNVGGVDLLLSAMYVPEINTDAVDVSPDSPLKLGVGARLGLIQESLVTPGVSVTILRRALPKTSIVGTTDQGDTLDLHALESKSTSWRLVAGKNLLLFGIAAGIGQDRYDADTDVRANVSAPGVPLRFNSDIISLSQKVTRTNMFVDLYYNLPFTKIVLEVGQATGGSVQTYNAFSGKQADASRVYGALGVRVGF